MNDQKNLVSVLLPAYNAEKYFEEALKSIINQTYTNLQIIIINDNSSDQTGTIAANFAAIDPRIEIITNESNLKLSKSLNKGINAVRGKYIARMDADDISYLDRIEKQVKFMEANPEIGISGGSMMIVDASLNVIGKRQYYLTDKDIRKNIFRFSPFCHPCIIIRSDVLSKSGLYNGDFNPAEDYELYFRIGMFSKFGNLSDYLLKYRTIPNSMTTGALDRMEEMTLKIKMINLPIYNARVLDYLTTYLHLILSKLIPSALKLHIFIFVRSFFAKHND